MIKILAIDPGLTIGFAVAQFKDNKRELITHGFYSEKNYNLPLPQRLNNVVNQVLLLLDYNPNIILIEDLNLSFDRKHKNRQDLQKYSAAWSAIYFTLLQWQSKHITKKIEIHIIPLPIPNRRGRSGGRKKMMLKAVEMNYGIKLKASEHHIAEAIFWAMNWRDL